jgi:hypothetical protein
VCTRANAAWIEPLLRAAQPQSAHLFTLDADRTGSLLEQAAQCRHIQHHRLDRLVQLRDDARALRHAQRGEQVGHHRAGALQIAPRIAQPVVRLDGDAIEVGGESRTQGGVEIGVGSDVGFTGHGGFLTGCRAPIRKNLLSLALGIYP